MIVNREGCKNMAEKEDKKEKEDHDFKKEYEKVQKKYSLPSFEELDTYFEIEDASDGKHPLRTVRKKIEEKLEHLAMQLNAILQPETKVIDLEECKMFTDEEKDRMLDLFKKLMIFARQANLISLDPSEKKETEFIQTVYEAWIKKGGVQEQMISITKKLVESWKAETKGYEPMGYLG